MSKKILPLNKFKHLIESDYSDFKIRSIKPLKSGWDNFAVEINKSYIFRFPKEKNINLKKEINILKLLNGRMSLQIPKYEFIGKKNSYVGYKKIIGEPLSINILKSLSLKNRRLLVNDIANFFYEFHIFLPIVQAKALDIEIAKHIWEPTIINKKVIGKLKNKDLSDFLKENLDKYLTFVNNHTDLSIIYNDFHEENVAFDKSLGRLTGVFDFSDVAVSNIYMEFYRLFAFNKKLTTEVINKYKKLSGRPIDIQKVFISAVVGVGAEIGFYSLKPNSKEYKDSLKNLSILRRDSQNQR